MEKELVSAFYDLSKELKQASPEQKIALVECMLDVYRTVSDNHSSSTDAVMKTLVKGIPDKLENIW